MNQYVQVALQAGVPTIAIVFGIFVEGRQIKAIRKMLDDFKIDIQRDVQEDSRLRAKREKSAKS
jgi:hypothetical protein